MKHLKFSRLFAAALVVACLALTGCKPQTEEVTVEKVLVVRSLASTDKIIGTWTSSFGEKFEITTSAYNNYSNWDYTTNAPGETYNLYYSTVTPYVYEISDTSGIIYSKFNDETHIGYGADVGQWYALYYYELTDNKVKVLQAYKDGGKAACDSLEEAVKEFSIENKYFPLSKSSACTKE